MQRNNEKADMGVTDWITALREVRITFLQQVKLFNHEDAPSSGYNPKIQVTCFCFERTARKLFLYVISLALSV